MLQEVSPYHAIDESHPDPGAPHALPQVPVIRFVQAPCVQVISQEAQMSTVENRGIANAAAFRRVGADATPSPGLHFHIHDAVGELPPPIEAGRQVLRRVAVASGAFTDWFAPHDARVYRFEL